MSLEPSMRPWRTAGMWMLAIGAAIAIFSHVAIPPGGGDAAGLSVYVAVVYAGPFAVVGAILYGIGLRRRPPS